MRAKISNFRGVAGQVELDLTGVTLVTGPNGSGKSSICQAVACALTGRPMPIAGLRTSAAGVLVHTGAAGGEVVLDGPDGQAKVAWPAAKARSEGQAPQATEVAAGLDHVVWHKPGERAALLHRYLQAEPTREDLVKNLPNLSTEMVDKVWARIEANRSAESNGWDLAHDEAKQKGARYKGQWEQITGERYGEKKAVSWVPAGWEDELATASEETLDADLAREREYLEALISTDAVSQDERRRLQDEAGQVEARRTALQQAEAASVDAEKALQAAKQEREGLPTADVEKGLLCPHCSQPVKITKFGAGTWLEKATAENLSEHDLKQRRLAIASCDGKIGQVSDELQRKQRAAHAARAQLEAAEVADTKLKALPPEHGHDSEQVEAGRERVRRAEARLSAFKSWRDATRIHRQIETNAQVVGALAKEGVRQTVTAKAIQRFVTGQIQPFCRAAGWPEVTFDDGLEPLLAGRLYGLLSESEQWKVRTVIQLAMAGEDGSDLAIVDGADVLDRAGRNGLLKAIKKSGLSVLLAMTTEDRGRNPPPDLVAAKLGRTYWIELGQASAWPLQKAA